MSEHGVTPSVLSDAYLAREAERTIMDYSWEWEGERERVEDLGGALLRYLDVPWSGIDGMVVHVNIEPARADEQLDAVIARSEKGGRKLWWVVGPSAMPADVVDRLVARGFERLIEWAGLALRDLSTPIPTNPDLVVEPLSASNSEEYAAFCVASEPGQGPEVYGERLAAAHRYLTVGRADTGIYLGRLDGTVAACVVSHIEPGGVVYLRNAVTLPEFRNRGIYLSLVAHRIAIARAAGCSAAIVQAQSHTSAPILMKRGFERVCTVWGLGRPQVDIART